MTDDKEIGLYEKFSVWRKDGQSEAGEKHHGCEYFVLDMNHDPHALPAIRAYAQSCRVDYPQLALEILSRARELATEYELAAPTTGTSVPNEGTE
jgi:hypothetical protein